MSKLNHYAISAILGSEIVGRVKFGHGQIAAQGDAQRYLQARELNRPPVVDHGKEAVDVALLVRAFQAARTDERSPDLYIADPERNQRFLDACRKVGLKASAYALNKALLGARKSKRLQGLKSRPTVIDHESYAFASEFAATQLRYRTGASIDDMLCEPALAGEFDALASRLAPGHTPLDYRWAILSIRKAGTNKGLARNFQMPQFREHFQLTLDPLEEVPEVNGVYVLRQREKPLYARAAADLRRGVELHRQPGLLSALTDKLWRPDPKELLVSFAAFPEGSPRSILAPAERQVVRELRPIFNIPRKAA